MPCSAFPAQSFDTPAGGLPLETLLDALSLAQGGEITLPEKRALFYLSQRPYLVAGSLRDQLQYPSPPTAVWAEAPPAAKERFRRLEGPGAGEVSVKPGLKRGQCLITVSRVQ